MIDQTVFKKYYTFMFHINYMDYSQDEMKQRFLETMKHFKFHRWVACEERGTQNNLLHLQAVLWHQDELIFKKSSSIKSFRFNKQRLAKKSNKDITQISFSQSKKDTLASYSVKDMTSTSFRITNLTKQELKLIPKWIDHKDAKKAFTKLVNQYAEDIKEQHPITFRNNLIDFYLANSDNIPNNHTLRKLSLKYNTHYTAQDYQDEIGSLRGTRFSQYHKEKYEYNFVNNI